MISRHIIQNTCFKNALKLQCTLILIIFVNSKETVFAKVASERFVYLNVMYRKNLAFSFNKK